MKQSRSDRDQTLAERGDEVGGESLNREESEERKDSSDGRGKGKKNCATPAMKSRPVGRPPLRRDALADGESSKSVGSSGSSPSVAASSTASSTASTSTATTSTTVASTRDVIKRRSMAATSSSTGDGVVRSKRRRTTALVEDTNDGGEVSSNPSADPLRGESSNAEGEGSTPSGSAGTSGLRTNVLTDPSRLNGFRSMKRHRPAELFRKDLISAMKLPDSEPLDDEEYLLIADPWRQEWERGVQVPVNPEFAPTVSIKQVYDDGFKGSFKLNPRKYLHAVQDANFQSGIHELTMVDQMSEQVCRYDLDDLDMAWLTRTNEDLSMVGEPEIHEYAMEKFVEEVENKCHEQLQGKIKSVEAAGIEFDDEIACNVCFALDGEDGNEMIFCDACDVCVHQACYGVQSIPEGDWLCRTCATGVTPQCVLCPKKGGAMKSTRSGSSWAHVACALWVPEVSIGDPDKMEPITNISQIPSQRWGLTCNVCKEKTGAPIQCSVKACKTAFHVTCAFSQGFDMKTVVEDNDDAVMLQGYCRKHTTDSVKLKSRMRFSRKAKRPGGESDDEDEEEMTEEEKDKLRKERIQQCREDFFILVKPDDVLQGVQEYLAQWQLSLNEFHASLIFNYWKLKRKSNNNKPLITPKLDEADALAKQQEDTLVARFDTICVTRMRRRSKINWFESVN